MAAALFHFSPILARKGQKGKKKPYAFPQKYAIVHSEKKEVFAEMRSVFEIIGPIMVGPSSSHTMGPEAAARLFKEEHPENISLVC